MHIAKVSSQKLCVIASIIVFAMLCSLRIYHLSVRSEIHSDETYSYMLAKHNEVYTTSLPDTILTGSQLAQLPHCDHSYADDISSLYHKNYDPPHASLYYMLFRTVLVGVYQYSPDQIILRGGLLNMLFWIVAFWLMFLLCRNIDLRRWWIPPFLLLVAFGNPLSITNTLMVREYQLAETFLIAIAYITMLISKDFNSTGIKRWILLIACGVGAMSTGYLNAYFVLLIYTWLIIKAFKVDNTKRNLLIVLGCGILTLALCWMLYLGYFDFILVKNTHTRNAFNNFTGAFDLAFYTIYLKSILTIPGVILLILGVLTTLASTITDINKNVRYLIVISAAAIFSIILAEYTSLLRETRYAYPFIALSILWIAGIVSRLNYFKALSWASLLTAIIIISWFTSSPNFNYGWQQMRDQLYNGATIYKLNNNELTQLSPCVNKSAKYILTSSDSILKDSITDVIIAHRNLKFDKPRKSSHVTGPLYIYTKE